MSEPQNPVTTTGLAYKGQSINLTQFENTISLPNPSSVTAPSKWGEYEPSSVEDVDYTDLMNVTKEIINLRIRLHQVRKELQVAKRMALKTKFVYEQEKKKVWIGITGGSDKSREAAAELMTAELYTHYLVANAVADEINEHSRVIRTELDALKEISNNLRRQIDLQ